MPKLIPFVGRQAELDTMMRQLHRWGQTCALVVDGDGGIGKSRLLQEAVSRCASELHVCTLPVKDLRDPRLKLSNRIELAIADGIGLSHFASYQQILTDIVRMQEVQVSRDTVERELSRASELFVENYNAFADTTRIVIPFDTLESIEDTPVWDYLIKLVSLFKNTLFLLSGRKAARFYDVLVEQLGIDNAQLLHLAPFEAEDARNFFSAELSYRRIKLSDEVADRIILLSGGKAILIDLAVERVARTNSLQWMSQEPLEAFNALTEKEQARIRQNFERDIVQYFANLGTHEEQLKLFMAHIHWVDGPLAARVLRIEEAEAQHLIGRMLPLTHIKEYPGGLVSPGPRITLHDEFARLITDHVYTEIDGDYTLRQEKSATVAEYLGEQTKALRERIYEIQQQIIAARQANRVAREVQLTIEKEESSQEYWKTAQEYLYHTLYAQPEAGAELFLELFDEATRHYRFRERDVIMEEILPYFRDLHILPSEMHYDVGIRLVQHQIDRGEVQQARERLEELLELYGDEIPLSIELYRLMGNVLVRAGEVDEGLKSFQRAVALSEQQTDLRLRARAENALGWAYRLVSYWKEACFHYRRALVISQELDDLPLQAGILNNLGFAYSYFNRREGINLCSRALEIWTQIDDQRGIGVANATIAGIYYQMNDPHEALTYFDRGLPIFQARRDREFLARVYSWLGATHFILPNLDKAEEYLRLSLEQGIKETEAQALNRLARVYRERGDLDMAETLLQQSYDISQQICDVLYELASLRDLISLAVEKRQYHRYGEFAKSVNSFEERWHAPDAHTHGGVYLYLAFLVLGQRRRDIALPKYLLRKAFERIAEYGPYANLEPKTYLDKADRFLRDEIESEIAREVGDHLWNYFKDQEDPAFHLALDYFNRWRRIDAE